jgi:hypothetical protein
METINNSSENIKAIIKTCDNDTQCYTFLFALRFKYFKDFFLNFEMPNNINLEKIILVYILLIIEKNDITILNDLGIFCNIADSSEFMYF